MTEKRGDNAIRVAIVDDEPLAREGIRLRLEHCGGFAVVGECGDGDTALDLIRSVRPDIVFIDFQMPGRTGIDVVEYFESGRGPYFVFVTAFDEHAIRAFELSALDYLVKPIADGRFRHALDRARRAVEMRKDAERARQFDQLLSEAQIAGRAVHIPKPEKMSVRIGSRIVLIEPADIDWIEADGDYAQLHVARKSWPLREPMASLESRLHSLGFVRIHRSSIVNTVRVVELRALDDGEYTVVLKDGTLLKLSRNYRQALSRLIPAGK